MENLSLLGSFLALPQMAFSQAAQSLTGKLLFREMALPEAIGHLGCWK